VQNGTVLVDILNKAAGDNKQGPFNKYDSTYYGGIGYYITAMNGTQENSTSGFYWFLFDQKSGGALPCGVSSYVPVNQSTTIFRYTTYTNHSEQVTGYCKQFPSSGKVCSYAYLHSLFLILSLKARLHTTRKILRRLAYWIFFFHRRSTLAVVYKFQIDSRANYKSRL